MREPLTDPAAERAVLAGIINNGSDGYLEVADILQIGTFTDIVNQSIFNVLVNMIEDKGMESVDEASMYSTATELNFDTLFKIEDNIRYIRSLFSSKISITNMSKWAAKIRKLHIARLMNEQLSQAKADISEVKGDESFDHIIGLVENRIFDFSMLLQGHFEEARPTLIGDGIEEYIKFLMDNPVEMMGISTGWPRFDEAIGGGLRRRSVTLIGARTGVGKGQCGINVTLHVSGVGIPVLYLDTEMGIEDHRNRSIANKSRVDIDLIETGKCGRSETDKAKVLKAAAELKDLPYTYVDCAGRPFEEIISIMRRWINKEVGFDENGNVKECVIIYDYLKLMTSEGISASLQEYQILGFQMTGLHNFAFRHNIPILGFIQLNRDGIDKETTAAASGSDRIVWLASVLAIFKPKTEDEIAEDGKENGNRKMVTLKTRHGKGLLPGDYICMNLEGGYANVTELGTKYELKQNKDKSENKNGISIEDDIDVPLDDDLDDWI